MATTRWPRTDIDPRGSTVFRRKTTPDAHREVERMVAELDLPMPYAQDTWLETVSRRLGRPIYCGQMTPELMRLLALVHPEHITGFTFTYRDGWLILLSAELDDLRRPLVLGHELAHICFGDVPAGNDPETNTDVSGALFALLGLRGPEQDEHPGADPTQAPAAAARQGYDLEDEQRAERLGTLLMSRAAERSAVPKQASGRPRILGRA